MKLCIYQAQMRVPNKPETALLIADDICRQAARLQADLVMLPEMFCCPYETGKFPVYAQPEGDMSIIWTGCQNLARTYGIYFSAGSMPELGTDGNIYNTAYVFDRHGNQIAKHRKMHLFDIDMKGGEFFKESDTLSAGNEITVFNTEFGLMGLCICFDFRFPELCRLMALKGAALVLVPAAFNMTTGPIHWELTFRSQAMYNQVFALGTAPARDLSASYHSWGHSIAVSPWGSIIAQMDEKEGFQLVELELSEVQTVREQLPLLYQRRTDVYTLTETTRV